MAADMVGSAVVQETVSRITSYLFSKCENDKRMACIGHDIERLEMAHAELELALERSARIPITDVSLLRRRKLFERAFKDCGDLLHKCIKQQTMDAIESERLVTHSFPKRIARVTQSSMSSYFTGFRKDNRSCSDVRRYEWFAECANRFLRDVESGCSARRFMFSNPIVRQLLEGKTLEYKMVQRGILRHLHIWPICVEGRGVEAALEFRYEDRKTPMRSFSLVLMLRLSESTDIVGTAIRCLQSFMPSLKPVAEIVIGELTQLPLQDISHSHSASCFTVQAFEGSNQHNTTDGTYRNLMADRPPLKLAVGFAPHLFRECTPGTTTVEIIGGKEKHICYSLQQMDETVRSKAISRYICQSDLTYYRMGWYPGHGGAYFVVQKSGNEIARIHKIDCQFSQGASKRKRTK
ncbi:unnamed protein product [Urochloa decumbens]|uniref:Uncharacterized protein n=1 Tax=Urochloa decumbens TaxID=240449 RepID=A0ABC9GDM6_9POAL